jgi:hypothetical protein
MADLSELRSKAEGIADRAKTEDARELATVVVELCRACEDIQNESGGSLRKAPIARQNKGH